MHVPDSDQLHEYSSAYHPISRVAFFSVLTHYICNAWVIREVEKTNGNRTASLPNSPLSRSSEEQHGIAYLDLQRKFLLNARALDVVVL